MTTSGYQKATEAAGNASQLAFKLGITAQAVSLWREQIPLKWVVRIEQATGIPREELHPDFGTNRGKRRVT